MMTEQTEVVAVSGTNGAPEAEKPLTMRVSTRALPGTLMQLDPVADLARARTVAQSRKAELLEELAKLNELLGVGYCYTEPETTTRIPRPASTRPAKGPKVTRATSGTPRAPKGRPGPKAGGQPREGSVGGRVLAVLKSADAMLGAAEVAKAAKLKDVPEASRALLDLTKRGLVKKFGARGSYTYGPV